MSSADSDPFLAACDVVDWDRAAVRDLAAQLKAGASGLHVVERLYDWVRDSIAHTGDVGQGKLTLCASEVLREGTGLCYAKSHLLVALLRAVNVRAGFCYQRLRLDEPDTSFCLHGMAAVAMPDGPFLRLDPRGNKPGIDARFDPKREALAYAPALPGELDLPGVFARPLAAVVDALRAADRWHPTETALPDIEPERWPAGDAQWTAPSRT